MPFTAKDHRERRKKIIQLFGGQCVDCGTKENLEFDHIDPKTKINNVTNLLSNWNKALIEAQKCELRCRGCHEEKTYGTIRKERQHGSYTMYAHQKCKCTPCKKANAEYMRQYRKLKDR